MDVRGTRLTPIVIRRGPAIKVDQQLSLAADLADGGHTGHVGVLSVLCLQLHSDLEGDRSLHIALSLFLQNNEGFLKCPSRREAAKVRLTEVKSLSGAAIAPILDK